MGRVTRIGFLYTKLVISCTRVFFTIFLGDVGPICETTGTCATTFGQGGVQLYFTIFVSFGFGHDNFGVNLTRFTHGPFGGGVGRFEGTRGLVFGSLNGLHEVTRLDFRVFARVFVRGGVGLRFLRFNGFF